MANAAEPGRPLPPGLPRSFEALAALAVLTALSPLLLAVALAVLLSSRGPIFFRQQRIGRGGEAFTFFKFRSMRAGRKGLSLTASGDSRVTAIGRVLRKFKLDELPGLWNVVRGDMALVGPRPEVPEYVNLADPLWREVLAARPGLTDPVTLRLRNEEELLGALEGDPEPFYTLYLLPFKLRGYRNYLARRSWRSDLSVLWNTFLGVLFPGRNPPPTSDELARLWSVEEAGPLAAPVALGSFWARHLRQLQFLLDLGVLGLAFVGAYLIRFDFALGPAQRNHMLVQLPVVMVIQLAAYFMSGLHTFVWRYISLTELPAFLRAAVGSALPIMALRLGLPERFQSWRVPLSVILIDTLLVLSGLLALRVSRRLDYERRQRQKLVLARTTAESWRVLLVGAGQAGVLAARELEGRADLSFDIRGFVDDDPQKQGTVIRGVRVVGTTADLPHLVGSLGIDQVIVTIADASPLELSRILEICHRIPIPARIIPGLFELLAGSVEVNRPEVETPVTSSPVAS